MNDIYTFIKLLEEYKIVIPVMQRSYAEGRNTKHAEDVRKSIIETIISSALQNKPLFFDFVYGNISQDEKKFIPFDGQQRLTTLFLFHRYVYEKAKEPLDILKKFSYETRPSAKEFLEKICINTIIPSNKENIIPFNEETLSKFVINQNWFFDDWKKDPTISSILTVLDEIHNQFLKLQSPDYSKIMSLLKDTELISFHFVNMQLNQLPNNTYVKMNARGKTLTGFENFKASLEEYLKKSDNSLYRTFRNNIDSKWLDLMFSKTKPCLPDSLFMSFFNRHFINVWNFYKKNEPSIEEKSIYDKVNSDLVAFPLIDTFISWSVYEKILNTAAIKNTIHPIFNLLTTLVNNSIEKQIKPYQTWDFYGCDKNDTYPARVTFFALLLYFEEDNYQKTSFSHWMRVVFNIIENQTIDSMDSYLYALRFFSELGVHSHDIYTFLADVSKGINSGFAKEQVSEERLKAKKILESGKWEKAIILAEHYEILLGKVNVLFQAGEKTSLEVFNTRFNLLKAMYKNNDPYHIIKVLLSYYDEAIPNGKISLKHTKENIKQLVTKTFFNEFQKITSDKINTSITQKWIKELSTTTLLNISRSDGQIVGKYGKKVVLWGTTGCVWKVFGNDVRGNILLGEEKRNLLLKSLKLPNAYFTTDYSSKDYIFYSGWETYFKYDNCFFSWWPDDDKKIYDVYIMTDDWGDYKKRKKVLMNKTNTDADEYFAFNTTDEMIKHPELFAEALKNLISESNKA